jgi:hypothetical protein
LTSRVKCEMKTNPRMDSKEISELIVSELEHLVRKAKRHAITLEEVQRQLPVYLGGRLVWAGKAQGRDNSGRTRTLELGNLNSYI